MSLNDGRVVSIFIIQALRNKPITIYGNGTQTRSFCFVSDLVEGFIKIMDQSESMVGPINLGNPNEFSMLQLAETVIRLTSSDSKITFEALPQDDPKQRKPDISLAQEMLNWSPSVALEEGILKTVSYFKEKI